jgi:hypothetical protein
MVLNEAVQILLEYLAGCGREAEVDQKLALDVIKICGIVYCGLHLDKPASDS